MTRTYSSASAKNCPHGRKAVIAHSAAPARYLTAAAALIRENEQAVLTCTDLSKAEQLGHALAKRYLRQGGANGRVHVRLLSAVTSGGICFLPDAISSVETLVVLEDEYGAAADRILHILQQRAAEHGLDIIACPCPVRPKHLEHLIFPQLSTAFVTANRYHSEYSGNPRRIHCTRFSEKSGLRARRARLRFNRKMAEELMEQVFGALTEAGEAQKAVDAVYSAAEIPEKMEKVCIRAKNWPPRAQDFENTEKSDTLNGELFPGGAVNDGGTVRARAR